jgi:3',5'-cyclic AMP phosphodiesterase CpdA
MEVLGLSKPYQSFDHGGWKFFTLDSIRPDPKDAKGYVAKLDDEQLDWFKRELDATPATTPIAVISHVPILGACAIVSAYSVSLSRKW